MHKFNKLDAFEIDDLKALNPSICYECSNSRRVDEKAELEGFTGCIAPFKHYEDFAKRGKRIFSEDRRTGTVDRHAKPFAHPSADSYSNILIIRGCISCPYFNV